MFLNQQASFLLFTPSHVQIFSSAPRSEHSISVTQGESKYLLQRNRKACVLGRSNGSVKSEVLCNISSWKELLNSPSPTPKVVSVEDGAKWRRSRITQWEWYSVIKQRTVPGQQTRDRHLTHSSWLLSVEVEVNCLAFRNELKCVPTFSNVRSVSRWNYHDTLHRARCTIACHASSGVLFSSATHFCRRTVVLWDVRLSDKQTHTHK